MEGILSLMMVAQTHGKCLVSDGDPQNTLKHVNDYLKEHVPYGKNYMINKKKYRTNS